jgi:hypothetical protein
MRFKVGDKVILREDSIFNNGYFNNPIFEVGEVVLIKQIIYGLPINVKWKTGFTNSYKESDLQHIVYNCKLNKVLYPDYKIITVDNKEFLVENTNDGGNK